MLVPLLELDAATWSVPGRGRAADALAAIEGQDVRRAGPPLRGRALMLLVVDVGNTQTHLGTYDGEELVEHWRFATVRESTADELGAALRNLLALRGLGVRRHRRLDRLRHRARAAAASGRRWRAATSATRCCWSGPGLKTGMPIRYDNPREIGPDRLVNAVAGYERVGGACVIVDFGTAVTHDVVSRRAASTSAA